MPTEDGDRVLVVAAHPDDEILGCGGTIAWHAQRDEPVHVLILAEGATSRPSATSAMVTALQEASCAACETLGALEPQFAGFPDNRMDTVALHDVILRVEEVVTHISPTIVYTHHAGDLNVDHRIVNQAVVTACRPLPHHSVRAVRAFETVSSTEWSFGTRGATFSPNFFIDIERQLDLKLRALEAYVSEMRRFPHARSSENVVHLARMRGASVGLSAAEAFVTVREVRT